MRSNTEKFEVFDDEFLRDVHDEYAELLIEFVNLFVPKKIDFPFEPAPVDEQFENLRRDDVDDDMRLLTFSSDEDKPAAEAAATAA